jgi:branched-chain amino acid aminotransferase
MISDGHSFYTGNRAFLYGDGFFETIFATGSRIPFFDLHFERITKAIQQYNFIPDPSFNKEKLRQDIEGLIHRNKSYTATRIRITFFRNEGGLFTPTDNHFSWFINSERLPTDGFELNKQGLKIDVYPDLKKNTDPFSAFKNISAQLYVQAGLYKHKNLLDECIILNNRHEVCESISSNIFLVYQKKVFTPALSTGCVDGVMRKTVTGILKNQGYTIKEGVFDIDALREAEEIFLTNAINGVRWVGAFRNKRFYNFVAKALIKELNNMIQ